MATTVTKKTTPTKPRAPKIDTAAGAPAQAKASPKAAAKKAAEPVVAVPVLEPEPAVVLSVEAAPVNAFEGLVATVVGHFAAAAKELQAGKLLLKKLMQAHNKDTKAAIAAAKSGRRSRPRDPNAPKRAPSGIAKPTKISPELAAFLGVEASVELARTDVIKRVAGYIKANQLENPENRREIRPDAALGKLLSADPEDSVTYFNLQKYMSKHFQKAVPAPPAP